MKLAISKRVRNVISDTSTLDDNDVFSETDTDDDTISVKKLQRMLLQPLVLRKLLRPQMQRRLV